MNIKDKEEATPEFIKETLDGFKNVGIISEFEQHGEMWHVTHPELLEVAPLQHVESQTFIFTYDEVLAFLVGVSLVVHWIAELGV